MQRKYIFIFAVVLLLTPVTQVTAQVPQLDVEKTCRAARPLLGGDSTGNAGATAGALGNADAAATYRQCMESEKAARKAAEDLWPKIGAAKRENCAGLSRMVYPSYVELLSCLQMYEGTSRTQR